MTSPDAASRSSATTGFRSLAVLAANSAGTSPPGTGLWTRPGGSLEPLEERPAVVLKTERAVGDWLGLTHVRWLGSPTKVDLGSTDGYGADFVTVGFDLPSTTHPDQFPEILEARRKVLEISRPLCRQLLMDELYRTRVLMSRSASSDEQFDLTAEIYADELRAYPGDIVIDALREVTRSYKWWPAWSEVLKIIERRARPRRALLAALAELARRAEA